MKRHVRVGEMGKKNMCTKYQCSLYIIRKNLGGCLWGAGLVIQKSMWTHHNEGSRLLYTDFERHYYCYECDQKLQKEMCVCMCALAYAFESELYKWLRIVPTKGRLCDRVKRLVTGQDFCFRHECLCMHSFLPIWASSLRCKSTEIHKNTWNRLDDIKALSGQGVGQIVLRCGGHLRRARKQG